MGEMNVDYRYISVCEFTAPLYSDKLDYLSRTICFGKHKDSTGYMFEPHLLGSKKVLKTHKLPKIMSKIAIEQWLKTKEANYLLEIINKVKPINKIM